MLFRSEEVMAEAMKNFAFDESNKLAWPVLGQIVLDYNMDETIFFKSLGDEDVANSDLD